MTLKSLCLRIFVLKSRMGSALTIRSSDLTCQVCGARCADDVRFFRHVHRHHPDYWRVLAGNRPLCDIVETTPWNEPTFGRRVHSNKVTVNECCDC
jgi:hypothetical protein